MLILNSRVKVILNKEDYVNGFEELEELINGEIGYINEISNFMFPYSVTFENKKIQKIMKEIPRVFSEIELLLLED